MSLEGGLLCRHCFGLSHISSHSFPLGLHDEPNECVYTCRRLLVSQTIHSKATDVPHDLAMVNSLDNLPSNRRICLSFQKGIVLRKSK